MLTDLAAVAGTIRQFSLIVQAQRVTLAARAPQVQTVKGIFWPALPHNQSRSYVLRAPALPVTALPYHALAPISSASGKALWHVRPTRDAAFDLLLCMRVPPAAAAPVARVMPAHGHVSPGCSAGASSGREFLRNAHCAWTDHAC